MSKKRAQFDPSWEPGSQLKELENAEKAIIAEGLDEVENYSIAVQKIGYTLEKMRLIVERIELEGSKASPEFFDVLSLLEEIFEDGKKLEHYGVFPSLEWGK